jgi:hypothetical protein
MIDRAEQSPLTTQLSSHNCPVWLGELLVMSNDCYSHEQHDFFTHFGQLLISETGTTG